MAYGSITPSFASVVTWISSSVSVTALLLLRYTLFSLQKAWLECRNWKMGKKNPFCASFLGLVLRTCEFRSEINRRISLFMHAMHTHVGRLSGE